MNSLSSPAKRTHHIVLEDRKASATDGGTFSNGAWRTRDLNTEVVDTGNLCTLASNQFTLNPGTYEIVAMAPAIGVNGHKAKLRNITDGADTIVGTSEYSFASNTVSTSSIVSGRFTITAQKTFEIQHYCQTSKTTNGFGSGHGGAAVTEVFARVELWKVA